MPEIDHTVIIKMFDVIFDNCCLFKKDRSSPDSFPNAPMYPIVSNRRRSWIRVRSIELVGLVVRTIRVDKLGLIFTLGSYSKSTHCGVDVRRRVDAVGSLHLASLGQERSRNVLSHIKISPIYNCIDNILL